IRPELSLGNHKQIRFQGPKVGPDAKSKIQRKVEDVCLAEFLPGEFLSGIRCRGDDHAVLRQFLQELRYELADREYFSDGNSMDPCCWLMWSFHQSARDAAESLCQSASIFPMANGLKEPEWESGGKRQSQKQAVEQVHEGRVILRGLRCRWH